MKDKAIEPADDSTATPKARLATILGADYSAARTDPNPTWLATGQFEGGGLVIYKLENIGSARLAEELLRLKKSGASVAAGLDFPFSWPTPFLDWLQKSGRSKKDLASDFEQLEQLALLYARERAKAGQKEPRRLTDDLIRPKAQSPLHRINPGMLKMTWQGSQLLDALRREGYKVAPFDGFPNGIAKETSDCTVGRPFDSEQKAPEHWLFEVYPAATLQSLGLPFQKYKGRSPEARAIREVIVEGLGKSSPLNKLHTVTTQSKTLPGLSFASNAEAEPAELARRSDDALDAVLACYSTCVALLFPALTGPQSILSGRPAAAHESEEGWIYSPYSPLVKI